MGIPLYPVNLLEINSYNPTNPANPKWQRTTSQQLKVLEAAFRWNRKPTSQMRQILSYQIQLPLRHVEVWFQNRRAKEKNQTCKSSLTKKARNDNGAIHGIAQTQTVRDETPLHEQQNMSLPPLSLPSTWDPTPTSTPSSPQSLIIVDSTISRWAEHEPNPYNPPPGVLPNTRSGFGWGLEDVFSVCSEPLPFTTTKEHIHSLDPSTVTHQDSVVDGHHQELALPTNHVYDVNMETLDGLSHIHYLDNRHHDMLTTKTEQNGSLWYLTSSLPVMYHCPCLPLLPYHTILGESHISGTSSTPSFDDIHNSSHSISHTCTPLASEGMAWQGVYGGTGICTTAMLYSE